MIFAYSELAVQREPSVSEVGGEQVMRDEASAEEVAWLISHLRALVATAPATWLRHPNLTLPQLTALHFICADTSLTLTGLADALGTRPPATSAMVDRLADAGLVRRVQDLEHRRRIRFHVTPEAAHMLGDIDVRTARRLQAVLKALSPERLQAAARLLSNLLWHLPARSDKR